MIGPCPCIFTTCMRHACIYTLSIGKGDISDDYTASAVSGCQGCHFRWQCDSFDGYHSSKPAQLRGEANDRESRHHSAKEDSNCKENNYHENCWIQGITKWRYNRCSSRQCSITCAKRALHLGHRNRKHHSQNSYREPQVSTQTTDQISSYRE